MPVRDAGDVRTTATSALWRTAVVAFQQGRLDDGGVRRLRALLKAAGRYRQHSMARQWRVLAEIDAMSAELQRVVEPAVDNPAAAVPERDPGADMRARLRLVSPANDTEAVEAERGNDDHVAPPTFTRDGVALASRISDTAVGRRRRKPVIRGFDAITGAAYVRDVLDGKIAWHEALTPVARGSTRTYEELMDDPVVGSEVGNAVLLLKAMQDKSPKAAWRDVYQREPTSAELHQAYRLRKKARANPHALPVDHRRLRTTKAYVMVPLVQALVVVMYVGRREASYSGVTDLVIDKLKELEPAMRSAGYDRPLPTITVASVSRYLRGLPKALRLARAMGMREVVRQLPVVLPDDAATAAHEIVEIDHTPLRNWVLLPTRRTPGKWRIDKLKVSAAVCACSGLPLAIHVSSRTPDAFSTSIMLHATIVPHRVAGVEVGGIPRIVRHDRGSDFTSHHVGNVARSLGITLEKARPRSPNDKPHVERFFRTLKKYLAKFPGHVSDVGKTREAANKHADTFLSAEEMIRRIQEFTNRLAKQRIKGERHTRIEKYATTHRPRYPERMQDLDLLLMKSDQTATLRRGAVHVFGEVYQLRDGEAAAPRLLELDGERMVIRYHPDIRDAVYVYRESTGERIGEFVLRKLAPLALTARAANDALPTLSALVRDALNYVREVDRAAAEADHVRATEARIAKVNGLADLEGHPHLKLSRQIPTDVDVLGEAPDSRSKKTRAETQAARRIGRRGTALPSLSPPSPAVLALPVTDSMEDYFQQLAD